MTSEGHPKTGAGMAQRVAAVLQCHVPSHGYGAAAYVGLRVGDMR